MWIFFFFFTERKTCTPEEQRLRNYWIELEANLSEFIVCFKLERISLASRKDPGKRGHIVADTFLPTQMFPRLPARATFVADTNFVFLILFRNILCPQQMFPSLRSPRNIMGNNVSATMFRRLPGP